MSRGKRRSSMSLEQIRAQVAEQEKKIAALDAEIAKLDESAKAKRKERNKLKLNLKNAQVALEAAEAKAKEEAKAEAMKADAEKVAKWMAENGKTFDDVITALSK